MEPLQLIIFTFIVFFIAGLVAHILEYKKTGKLPEKKGPGIIGTLFYVLLGAIGYTALDEYKKSLKRK